jgi:hypothetical protein
VVFNIMQVELINSIYYSHDALCCFSHKQFVWITDYRAQTWGITMMGYTSESIAAGCQSSLTVGRCVPHWDSRFSFGAMCTGLRHDHQFGTAKFIPSVVYDVSCLQFATMKQVWDSPSRLKELKEHVLLSQVCLGL